MLLNQFLSVSFIEKAGDFTDDVGNLQPGNRISCKTGGVKRSEKKIKIKPDVVLKNFWKNNAHFADLFNAAVFQGEQVLKPEDLKEADTDVSSVLKFNGHAETVQKSLGRRKENGLRSGFCTLGVGKSGEDSLCDAASAYDW